MNKIAVQFAKFIPTSLAFERLLVCTSCDTVSSLRNGKCLSCGTERPAIPLRQHAGILAKRARYTRIFLFSAAMMLAACLARTLPELGLALAGGGVLIYLLHRLDSAFKDTGEQRLLHKFLFRRTGDIVKGLALDLDTYQADIKGGFYKEAYEKLREIGVFLHDDRIKLRKIMCLNHFIIRKDMELELASVVPGHFDKDFIVYLRNAVMVNKQLVRSSVLDYVLAHKREIEALETGKDTIVLVMGAALRMKRYIRQCEQILTEYAAFLPKERFLRLCAMIHNDPDFRHSPLYTKCSETVKVRYGFDPDFHDMFK